MNIQECAAVVGKVRLGDNRHVDDLIIGEWFVTIGFLNYQDAIAGVTLHRQESTDYLQPAHIIRLANRVKDARAIANGPVFCVEHDGYPLPCDRCARDGVTS